MVKKTKKQKNKTEKHTKRNATIGKEAFIGMMVNAIEVYKKETFGILIGEKHKKHYLVTDTIAAQTAKRGYEWVNVKANRINKMNFALSHLTHKKAIGDFHSHPEGPDRLSDTDVADLLDNVPTTLTVLVSMKRIRKCEPWKVCADKSLCGTIGGRFFVKLMAFETVHKKHEVRQIKIVCPYIRHINKTKLYKDPVC